MSNNHPNLVLISHFFEAYAAQDLDAVGQILAPDIRWVIPGEHPLSGVKTGLDEVMNYFKQLGKGAFQASPIVMGVNDEYVIDCHMNWSNVPDIENFRGMSCLLWKIRDGRIVEVYNFPEDQHKTDRFFNQLY